MGLKNSVSKLYKLVSEMNCELNLKCIDFLLQEGPPHKCALIFADNSGIDIILGVFPFVRELLSRGTEVSIFHCTANI